MKNKSIDTENFIRRGSRGISQMVLGVSIFMFTLNYYTEDSSGDKRIFLGYVAPTISLIAGASIYFSGRYIASKLRDLRHSYWLDDSKLKGNSNLN